MSDHGPNVRAAKAEILLEDARKRIAELEAEVEILKEYEKVSDSEAELAEKRIEELECHLAISRGKHENCIAENERLRVKLRLLKSKAIQNALKEALTTVLEDSNESHQD